MKLSLPFLHLCRKWCGFINSVEELIIASPHEYVKSCIEHCLQENRGNEVSLACVQIFLSMHEIDLLVHADKKDFCYLHLHQGIYGKIEGLRSLEECSKVHTKAVKNLNIR